jgi:hypothetical protein
MKFSQRIGKQPIKQTLDKELVSPELRNTLWTLILEFIIDLRSNSKSPGESFSPISVYFRELWIFFFKWPIDNLPMSYGSVNPASATSIVRNWFFTSEWYQVYDFIEFSSKYHDSFADVCNSFLKTEMSAYRFVDGHLVEVTADEEIAEIENAIKNTDKFVSVKTHLQTSIQLLSDKKTPDYRNSIKESISAVESLAKIITKNDKATLGQALNEFEKNHNLPGSLKSAFSALYGYTSDQSGIRHGLLEKSINIDLEEAKFMLIACSAFTNYLISKI